MTARALGWRLLPLAGVAAVLLAWLAIWGALRGTPREVLFPSPLLVAREFAPSNPEWTSWGRDLAATLLRTAAGFALGACWAIPAGFLLGANRALGRAGEFIVDFFRSLPASALVPVFFALFGLGERARVALIAMSCGLVVLVSTIYAVRNFNATRRQLGRVLGAGWFQSFRHILLPGALPEIAGGLRVSLSLALILTIVTELVVSTDFGLGTRIDQARYSFNYPRQFALVVIAGAVGYALNKLFVLGERRLIHWAGC